MNYKKLTKIAKFSKSYFLSAARVPLSERMPWNISVPVQVYWMVTRKCNYECLFCDVIRHEYDVSKELQPDDGERFVNQMADMGIYKLGISGGEPMLRKKLILPAIRTANRRGVWTGLGTNASTLNEENIEELAVAGVNHLSISLDGLEETQVKLRRHPNAWSAVANALKIIGERRQNGDKRMFVKLNYVLNNENIDEVIPVMDYAAEQGVPIIFVPYNTYNQTFIRSMTQGEIHEKDKLWISPQNESKYEKVMDEIILRKKRYPVFVLNTVSHLQKIKTFFMNPQNTESNRCGSAYRNIHIDPVGDVIPCWTYTQSMGNVKDMTLKEIWYSDKYNNLRKEMLKCNLLCMGGCRLYPAITDLATDAPRMALHKLSNLYS